MNPASQANRPPGPPPRRWRRLWLAGTLLLLPFPLLAVNAPQDVRIPPLKPRPSPPPARFSHWEHNSQRCFSCHPGAFPQGLVGFTHQDMREGRFCATCHDGQGARPVAALRCERCHAAP